MFEDDQVFFLKSTMYYEYNALRVQHITSTMY